METAVMTPIDTVVKLLQNLGDASIIRSLVHEDVIYVSLNYDNPDLHKIMPWCGTNKGAASVYDNMKMINTCWETLEFNPAEIFGSDDRVAIFGTFKYRSRVMNKIVNSPFSIFAKLKGGKISYFQFMEDTFATAASFFDDKTGTYKNFP
jgi:ketosteroid isomerase-like protein